MKYAEAVKTENFSDLPTYEELGIVETKQRLRPRFGY
jgi:hypothetical protein